MVSLGQILGTDNLAYRSLYSVTNRPADAIQTSTPTDSSKPDSDTIVIARLLQGDIAAQGQIIHNSQTTISMLQTFDAAAAGIIETLTKMAALATSAQTGVYSDAERALIQVGFEDLAQTISAVAGLTQVNGYPLLSGDGDTVRIYIGNNTSVDIESTDLGFSIENLDLVSDADGALDAVNQALSKTSEYRAYLGTQMDAQASQVAIADSQVAQQMGYSLDVCNQDLAQQLALEVISKRMAQNQVSIQDLVNPNRTGVIGLLS